MNIEFLPEPRLEFARGEHVCPRRGIATYGVYDSNRKTRRDTINVGAVGTAECLEGLSKWLGYCAAGIEPLLMALTQTSLWHSLESAKTAHLVPI